MHVGETDTKQVRNNVKLESDKLMSVAICRYFSFRKAAGSTSWNKGERSFVFLLTLA